MKIHIRRILGALGALALVALNSAQAQTVYIGNSLTASGGADGLPPLVILGEYGSAGPLSNSTVTLPAGTVQDVKFYGQTYNFNLYALAYAGPGPCGPACGEQTFQVVGSQSFSGSPASPGIQTITVSNFTVNAGNLLAFAGTGPYYLQPPTTNGLDATYSSSPSSYMANPPVLSQQFTVGTNGDTNATYEYIPSTFTLASRTYAIGVDVSETNLSLPVYHVTQEGATLSQAMQLAISLNVPTNGLAYTNGLVSFIDLSNFMAIPFITISNNINPAISNLVAETRNPISTNPITVRAFDFAAISNLSVFSTNIAVDLASNALASAGLTPQFGAPVTGHHFLYAFATNTDQTVSTVCQALDTLVAYAFQLPSSSNNIPLIGPGTQAQVSFGPTGNVTRLLYAVPRLVAGPSVNIISPTEASNRVAGLMPPNAQIVLQLVYWSPSFFPLASQRSCSNCPPPMWNPTNIIPYYLYGGTLAVTNPVTGSNDTITLSDGRIPATDDTNFVPSMTLSALQIGSNVVASVSVSGGSPPYTYLWNVSGKMVSGINSSSISYAPVERIEPPPLTIADPGPGPHTDDVMWPYPSTGFVLESTTNLAVPNWSQVTSMVQTNAGSNGFNVVAIPVTNADLFLRLRLASQTVSATESLSVQVTDANGVSISSNMLFTVQAQPVSVATPTPDPVSFGIEDPYSSGAASGFAGAMNPTTGPDGAFFNSGSPSGGENPFWHQGDNALPGDWVNSYPLGTQVINPYSQNLPAGAYPLTLTAQLHDSGVNTIDFMLYESDQSTPTSFSFMWPGPSGNMGAASASTWNQLSVPSASQFNANPNYYAADFNYQIDSTPSYYEDFKPLIIYASWGSGGPLKWIVFDSPNVLQYDANDIINFPNENGFAPGYYFYQRWGSAFNNLHLILGWHYENNGGNSDLEDFAGRMLGNWAPLNLLTSGYGPGFQAEFITEAWMIAADDLQYSVNFNGTGFRPALVPVAMGSVDSEDYLGNPIVDFWDDYPGFGMHTLGPDIPARSINGYWYLYSQWNVQVSP